MDSFWRARLANLADDPNRLIGIVTRSDLLVPRAKHREEEEMRERFLGPRLFSFGQQEAASKSAV